MQFRIDLDKCGIYLETFYPTIFFSANYSIKGQLAHLEVDAEGIGNGTSTNSTMLVNVTCATYLQNDKEHIKVNDVHVELVKAKFEAHLGEIFKGNDSLNEVFDKTINENIEAFMDTTIPGEIAALGALFKETMNKVFSKYSVKEIFEDN
uniref:Lipid-binding serum glycoprotein N-terminal domain-containing protein n=2 Tax=Photinus pyralis TaxID=7054 RepID=A0A1Y1NHJ8_PHOPY